MAISVEDTVKAATTPEDQEPFQLQLLRERGRSNSPVVVIYDCEQRTVQVQSKKSAEPKDDYQIVPFPARSKQVTLFVDEETESKWTTESTNKDGQSNVLLAQLHLDRLGPYGQIFRFFGLLSTLYVKNAGPLSTTSSQTINV